MTKFKERVRVDTVIVEQPDGTKITTIKEKRDTDNYTKTVANTKKWRVGLSASHRTILGTDLRYTIHLERRVLGGLYMGLYGRTDGEFGAGVSYSF